MNIHEFAKMLNGREKGNVLTDDEQEMIKKLGWSVSFGKFDGNLDFPHATFNLMNHGVVWCKGIVFDIKDLG